jgi:hypothetical protein
LSSRDSLVILLVVCSVAFFFIHAASKSVFGEIVTTNVAINRCDESKKCFNLKGTAYVVSTTDTEKICHLLASKVNDKHLTANNKFMTVDCKTLAEPVRPQTDPSSIDARSAGSMIALSYSGGLFGQYNFPYGSDGRALYVSMFADDGKLTDSDSMYVIQSEMGVTDQDAKIIYKKAKQLTKNQYILFVAE